jgi:cytosine/adenosine deaminase-related metal-dependent hydrolase
MSALREHDLYVSITPESECHYGHGQTTGHLISDQASIGVDTNWTFSGDLLSQARLWLQVVRKTNYEQLLGAGKLPRQNPMDVEQAFLLVTRQGGRAVRRADIGVLQVGAKADIVVVNGDSPNMLGWNDPVAAVMLHANASDIEHVLVDGQFRKRDFKLVNTRLAWAELRSRFLEAAGRIQPQIATPTPAPDKLWGQGEMGDVEIATTIRPS